MKVTVSRNLVKTVSRSTLLLLTALSLLATLSVGLAEVADHDFFETTIRPLLPATVQRPKWRG
jgi:hypothetical protein